MTTLPAYILIDADGSLLEGFDTADAGFDALYDRGVGAYVIPTSRVKVTINQTPIISSRLFDLYTETLHREGAPFAMKKETAVTVQAWWDRYKRTDPLLEKKIQAIKEARTEFGFGLGNAKAFMDQVFAEKL